MKLHHLALGARNVRKVAQFYQDAFALPLVREHFYDSGDLRSIWLDLGGAILMVEHTEESARKVDGVGAGPFLLAFDVTASERASIEARLVTLGAAIESRTKATSYSRDPEGNRVAISHYGNE